MSKKRDDDGNPFVDNAQRLSERLNGLPEGSYDEMLPYAAVLCPLVTDDIKLPQVALRTTCAACNRPIYFHPRNVAAKYKVCMECGETALKQRQRGMR